MTRSQALIFVYVMISMIEIFGDLSNNVPVVWATKPLLMPTLLAWFLYETKGPSPFRTIISISLVAAFFGDTFLMFVPYNEVFFLLGLGSFLVGQVLYGWGFIKNIKTSDGQGNRTFNLLVLILFGAFYGILMGILYPKLGTFAVPVLVYGLAICFMGLTAAFRQGKVNSDSFVFTLAGALIFVVSDTCIALDKFYFPNGLPYAQVIIMLTYCTAQFLLVKGAISYLNSK